MNSNASSLGNLYQSAPGVGIAPEDAAKLKQLEAIKAESIDHTMWAASQSLALAKLQVFHKIAKAVNDQQ